MSDKQYCPEKIIVDGRFVVSALLEVAAVVVVQYSVGIGVLVGRLGHGKALNDGDLVHGDDDDDDLES